MSQIITQHFLAQNNRENNKKYNEERNGFLKLLIQGKDALKHKKFRKKMKSCAQAIEILLKEKEKTATNENKILNKEKEKKKQRLKKQSSCNRPLTT